MRLIDADALTKRIEDLPNCYNGFSDAYDKACIIGVIDEQSTIEAKPVKHGRWEWIGGYGYQYRCSECFLCAEHRTKYCPNCGAKMDGMEHGGQ